MLEGGKVGDIGSVFAKEGPEVIRGEGWEAETPDVDSGGAIVTEGMDV